MQYPASASYRNNPRASLVNQRGEFPANVHGPYEVARAEVNGSPVEFDRKVSRSTATTGQRTMYVVREVGADSLYSCRLVPMTARRQAECYPIFSGNLESHIRASNGESHWLFGRASECGGDRFMNSLREGGRNCSVSALATYVILVEHYAQYAMSRCDRIEVVSSTQVDHCFVRVWLRDGSCVIHDHWINPEAFLPEDGRFSTVNDLIVVAVWRPGDGVQFRWEDLKRQARSLGEIRDVELPPEWQPFLGNSSSSDLVSYAKRKILTNGRKDRTETDCLLTREQAAQKGMQPNEQVVYHHRGHYYSNDIVAESSIERLDEPADRPKFPELHLQQAQWELEVEGACVRQDRQELTRLLQRTDVRQWFPERHRDLCLGATNTALCGPLDERNMALIGELYKNAIDASTATQMNMMLRMRMIDDALKNRDRPALTRWLNTQSLAACGDQGSRWLMMACMHLDVRGVRRLLKAGAQFGASHGLENGLSLAIQAGGADMVKLLLRRGASALRPNGVGLVAWEFAQQMLRDAHAAGGDVARQREVAAIICGEAVAQAIALQPSNLALLETLRAGIDDEALRDNLTLAVEMIEHAQADSAQEGLQ